ncbi:unnamed protein product [Parajaminaea phylloscopi]
MVHKNVVAAAIATAALLSASSAEGAQAGRQGPQAAFGVPPHGGAHIDARSLRDEVKGTFNKRLVDLVELDAREGSSSRGAESATSFSLWHLSKTGASEGSRPTKSPSRQAQGAAEGNPGAVSAAVSQAGNSSPTVSNFSGVSTLSGKGGAAKETGSASVGQSRHHHSGSVTATATGDGARGHKAAKATSKSHRPASCSKGTKKMHKSASKHSVFTQTDEPKSTHRAQSTHSAKSSHSGASSAMPTAAPAHDDGDGNDEKTAKTVEPSGTWTWAGGAVGCPEGARRRDTVNPCTASSYSRLTPSSSWVAKTPSSTSSTSSSSSPAQPTQSGRMQLAGSDGSSRVMMPINKRRLEQSFEERLEQYNELKKLRTQISSMRKSFKSRMSKTSRKGSKRVAVKKSRKSAAQGTFTRFAARQGMAHATAPAAYRRGFTPSSPATMRVPLPFIGATYQVAQNLLPALVGWTFSLIGLTPLGLFSLLTYCGAAMSTMNAAVVTSVVSSYYVLRTLQADLVVNEILPAGSEVDGWFAAACIVICALQVIFALVIRISATTSSLTNRPPRGALLWLPDEETEGARTPSEQHACPITGTQEKA